MELRQMKEIKCLQSQQYPASTDYNKLIFNIYSTNNTKPFKYSPSGWKILTGWSAECPI